MATTLLTKKTILSVSKSMPLYASRLSTPSFSTAYERAEGANAVAEASNDNATLRGDAMYQAKQDDLSITNDVAKEGPIKAVEGSDMVRDTAKETMDGAWKAAQEGSHKVGNGQTEKESTKKGKSY